MRQELACAFIKFDKTQDFNLYMQIPDLFFGQDFEFNLIKQKIRLYNAAHNCQSPIIPNEIWQKIKEGGVRFFLINEDLTKVFEVPGGARVHE